MRHGGHEGHAHSGRHHHHHAHDEDEAHLLMLSGRHFRVLWRVFLLTCIYLLVEVAGALASGSLALLADGFHMFADAVGVGLSLFASWLSHRSAPEHRTFGYQRVEILAAFFNALLLIGMSGFILFESYDRFLHPGPIRAGIMLAISVGGFFVNLLAARLLHQDHNHNLNMKGAYLHVLGDLLGSAGAVAAGLCILWFGWRWADPLISVLVAALILHSAFHLLKESFNILLEGCPSHIDIREIHREILQFDGVEAIHNLHVWHISMQRAVLTAHLEVTPEAFSGETLMQVRNALKEKFGLTHVTLQLELP